MRGSLTISRRALTAQDIHHARVPNLLSSIVRRETRSNDFSLPAMPSAGTRKAPSRMKGPRRTFEQSPDRAFAIEYFRNSHTAARRESVYYAAPETASEGFRVRRVRYRAFVEFRGMAASLSHARQLLSPA